MNICRYIFVNNIQNKKERNREGTANQQQGFSALSLVIPGGSGVGSQVYVKVGLNAGLEFESFLLA